MSAIQANNIVTLAPTYRLQWEEAQQADVLLYPEGMVTLNPSASAILKHCDGSRTVAQLVGELERQFEESDLSDDVLEFLNAAAERGWVLSDTAVP